METRLKKQLLGRRQTNLCFHFAGSGENLPDITKSRDASMNNRELSLLLNTGAEGNSPLTTSYRRRIFACLSRFFRARGGPNDFCLHAYAKSKCDGRICLGLEHYKPVLHREL